MPGAGAYQSHLTQGTNITMIGLFNRRSRPPVRRVRRPSIVPALRAPGPSHQPGSTSAQSGPSDESARIHAALRESFTPTQPHRKPRGLAGRAAELELILQAISYNRAHVVLYGDRGRGKTSLVNMVAASARTAGYMVGRYACSHGSDFDEIIHGLACDLPRPFLSLPAVDDPGLEGCEAALPQRPLHPRDIALLPGRLSGGRLVLIIDEFDRVADTETRARLADTIKQVSDRGARLSIVVVGVSDSLEELLGRHPSIQRNIIGVHLPLLSDRDVKEIVAAGARQSGLEYPDRVCNSIVALSRGVPYIVHLLGLHAGESSLRRGARVVTGADLRTAIARAVVQVDPTAAVTYAELTRNGTDSEVYSLLSIIAAADHDRFGRFAVQALDTTVRIADRNVAIEPWTRLCAAGVVRRCRHAGFDLYTFAEPMLLHYILLTKASAADATRRRATEAVS